MKFKPQIALFWALTASLLAGPPAFAADHRDSPSTDDDPAADINDVYMFRDPNDASKLVLVLSTFPLEDPRFATSYQYNSDVVFRIGFDLTGTGQFTRLVTARFSKLPDGPGSQQSFTVELPDHKIVQGLVTRPTIQSPKPAPIITHVNDIKVFAGQRDDPFFFDLIGFNRVVAEINATSVNGGPGTVDPSLFTGIDSFAGFNVQALVIEAPITDFVGSAQKFGISAFSYRRSGTALPPPPAQPQLKLDNALFTQADRMGNPAVNTAFIPPALKNKFNDTEPAADYTNYATAILATLAKYGTNQANTSLLASIVFPDTLKMDLSQPDGFPNGRRLADDVVNLELQITFNQQLGGPFNDGVTSNDVPYLKEFPFVAPPHTVKP
jgi:hypothetical protein